MSIGRISGKATTREFSFELVAGAEVRKFEYVKALHRVYGPILCQVVEIELREDRSSVKCHVIGYRDEEGRAQHIRIPLDIGTQIEIADDAFVRAVILAGAPARGAYIGKLDGKDVEVRLDLSKLLTRHVAVLAKSGAGKSYAVGVLIEEILENAVPVLVIDPHGEYGRLGEKNTELREVAQLERFGLKPKAYRVREYGDPRAGVATPLRLPNDLSQQELLQLIPAKLNNTQLGVLYAAIKDLEKLNFENVLAKLELEESSAKFAVINLIEHLRSLNIFSNTPVSYNELIKPGRASIINLRGIAPEIQNVIVYKLAKDLFELRKVGKVAPFFLVVEEAHNYCPERSFGEATSSKILRTIASEGRKFGLGLCVISQRPARVDKSVLSQCTTQIILKVTNPNDLKAVSSSVEGLTAESEAEIQNLPIGTALVTGVVDQPLFVNIRPRRTQHGGHAVDILDQPKDFLEQAEEFEEQGLVSIIRTIPATGIPVELIPAYLFACEEKTARFRLLLDRTTGEVVLDLAPYRTAKLPELEKLSASQIKLLMAAHALKRFSIEQLIKRAAAGVELKAEIADLVKKGYVVKEDRAKDEKSYAVSPRYLLAKLPKAAFTGEIISEASKLPRLDMKFSLDKLRDQIGRFTKVLDQQECWVER